VNSTSRYFLGSLRLASALLVVVAVGALASIALTNSTAGSASAAYYGYCPPGSAGSNYAYCPPPRVPAHFTGYVLGSEVSPAIHGEDLVLQDQFIRETVHRGQPPQLLLVPTEKRRQGRPPEPIQRADEHQKCWRLTGGRRQDRSVRVSNQFVQNRELIVKEPYRLCAPAVKSLTGPPTTTASDTQHYKCYRVEERPRLTEETVNLVDQFGTMRVVVRRAELLCNPTRKERASGEIVVAPRPAEHLVCYGINEQAPFAARTVFTRDQFGSQRVRVIDPLVLCVPSTKIG
jgi:hypothetical protein